MKHGFTLFLLLFSALTASPAALAEEPSTATTAPYLLAGAPTFDLSISQFRENFNTQNPKLILNEFRAIDSSRDRANLTRAASKINENLYASSALERGTLKIKSMQITWLPIQGPEQKAAKAKALEYMTAVIRTVAPLLNRLSWLYLKTSKGRIPPKLFTFQEGGDATNPQELTSVSDWGERVQPTHLQRGE